MAVSRSRRRPGRRDRSAPGTKSRAADTLDRRSRELASLLEVSQALSATLDLDTVLQRTTDSGTRLFGIESAAVYRLEGERLYLGATTPPLPSDLPEAFRSAALVEHPHIKECVSRGRPVVLPDTQTARLTASERAIVEGRGLRTVFYVPILLKGRPTGVLILGTTGAPRTISQDELDLARTTANLIAVAIQNATLHREAVLQSEALRAESQINEALADLSAALVHSGSSLKSVAHIVLERAKLLTGSEHGFVGSVDPLTRDLVVQTSTMMLGRERQVGDASPVFPIGADGRYEALWGHCLNTKHGFYTNSPHTHEPSEDWPEGHVPVQNLLSVPAIMGDRLVGQIGLANCPRGYTDRSLALVERLAELLAIAIERTRSESALRDAEKMAAMGSLVGSVAHEVRNPLFALSAVLDAFEARHGGREEDAKHVDLIREQVDRVSQLMQELLEYGRPQQLTLRPQCLWPIIRGAVESCRHEAEKRQVATRLRLPATLANVAADGPRLGRMVQNVVLNAIQHAPAGGFVEVGAAEVEDGKGPQIECTVRDSGPGFSEEAIRRAFDPFFTRRQGGTGLGLAIVRKIVEEHLGSITLGNAPEGGAIVWVRLPRSEGG